MLGWAQLANIAMDQNNLDEAFMYLEFITREIQMREEAQRNLFIFKHALLIWTNMKMPIQ